MLIVKVKICGITNLSDAEAAVEMGADLLGFNFYPKSPRYIEPQAACKLINQLPAFIDTVGVFVNSSLEQINEMAAEGQLNWVQLHGDETPQFCESLLSLSVKTMKAIRVRVALDEKLLSAQLRCPVEIDRIDCLVRTDRHDLLYPSIYRSINHILRPDYVGLDSLNGVVLTGRHLLQSRGMNDDINAMQGTM